MYLELILVYFDIRIFCNFVSSMMMFLDQFFGKKKTKLDRDSNPGPLAYESDVLPLHYRGLVVVNGRFLVQIRLQYFLPKNWSKKYHHGGNKITEKSYVKVKL